ncbi:IS1380 family transposase, partial [Jatrophihabitans sp. DSM 44399]|nr:IS1380 family transposase [Jatrophihabitans sp. DSM 44399]
MSIDHHPGVEDELCAPHVFTFGHVRQLDAVASDFLTALAGHAPLLPGIGEFAFLDIDDTV